MNAISSSEDIKPPLGLNGVMKVPSQPTGTSLSLIKHICAICGGPFIRWHTQTHTHTLEYTYLDDLQKKYIITIILYVICVFTTEQNS